MEGMSRVFNRSDSTIAIPLEGEDDTHRYSMVNLFSISYNPC